MLSGLSHFSCTRPKRLVLLSVVLLLLVTSKRVYDIFYHLKVNTSLSLTIAEWGDTPIPDDVCVDGIWYLQSTNTSSYDNDSCISEGLVNLSKWRYAGNGEDSFPGWRDILDRIASTSDYEKCVSPNNSITQNLLKFKSPDYKLSVPPWVAELCPSVVEHFESFPLFDMIPTMDDVKDPPAPIQSTEFAIRSTCALKITYDLAHQIRAPMYLHAGTALGAALHAGPIPWDDDVDVFIGVEYIEQFLEACENFIMPEGSKLTCFSNHDTVKLAVKDDFSVQTTREWTSPFIDICRFKIENGSLHEIWKDGSNPRRQKYKLDEFFPSKLYYYAGLALSGPSEAIARGRYDAAKCFLPGWNHRWERKMKQQGQLDCCMLAKEFPFVHSFISRVDPNTTHQLVKVDGKSKLLVSTSARNGELSVYGKSVWKVMPTPNRQW